MGNRFMNVCLGIRCGQGLETRLLGPTLEGSGYCCSNLSYCTYSCRCLSWTHHMRVKTAYHADLEDAEWATQRTPLIPGKPRSS